MNPDLQSTLDAIDEVAVHRCGYCDTPLGPEAPSSLFCDGGCQEAFYAARSEALVGYREPRDIPQHVYNQVEESSPETTAARPFPGRLMALMDTSLTLSGNCYVRLSTNPPEPRDEVSESGYARRAIQWSTTGDGPFTWTMGDAGDLDFTVTVDTSALDRALRDALAAADRMPFGDRTDWHPIGLINSLKEATTVEPGPECLTDGVAFDFGYPSTAALAAEQPPAPVMAPYLLDVEAIQRHIDGGGLTPERIRTARRIDPRRSR